MPAVVMEHNHAVELAAVQQPRRRHFGKLTMGPQYQRYQRLMATGHTYRHHADDRPPHSNPHSWTYR
jgi:hypothetical protein